MGECSLRVEFVTALSELAQLGNVWEAFNGKLNDHDAVFFQSHAWCQHVASMQARPPRNDYRLCVAKVLRNGHLIGIWPLSLQRHSSIWLARNLDYPFGQFAGVLFYAKADIAPGVAAVINELRARRLADGIRIDGVIAGSSLHQALLLTGSVGSLANYAAVVDLRPYSCYADFLGRRNVKTLRNLRNAQNRLQRNSLLTTIATDDAQQVTEIVIQTFSDRLAWLTKRGKASEAFENRRFSQLVSSLSSNPDLRLLAFSLLANGKPISQQWGFVYGSRYYAYISARNEAFDEFSPGRLHLGKIIEHCHGLGLAAVELMAPPAAYKMSWTDETKPLFILHNSFSVRGFVILELWLRRMRPQLVTFVRVLPSGFRRAIVGLAKLPFKPRSCSSIRPP